MRTNNASDRVNVTCRLRIDSTGRYSRFTSATMAVTVPTVNVGSNFSIIKSPPAK